MAKPKRFATETALCAHFIDSVDKRTWTPYAETGGWDILLVRKVDGLQIGMQAKLKLNAAVVAQTIEEYGGWWAGSPGPDCRAVLVPTEDAGPFDRIASYIGFTIVRVTLPDARWGRAAPFRPDLPDRDDKWHSGDDWHEWAPAKRHQLPEYVPDVAAGASAPQQLTPWKIRAIKIAVILERRGYLVRTDFKHVNIDHRRWMAREPGWLRQHDGRWVAGDRLPNFKAMHPKVYDQIAADAAKWMPPTPSLFAQDEAA